MSPFVCNHDGSCSEVRLCCMDTRMTLTREDVIRICSLGYDREYYAFRASDGFIQLRNVEGHCFFYDVGTGLCKIYESRPEGCRYYPVIYDARKRRCVVDQECPSACTVDRTDIRGVCHKVRRAVEQMIREARIFAGES
ncbi:MAG: YkgJ family cysteine cluster protein [Candidatus Thorarchaeota archaeon]